MLYGHTSDRTAKEYDGIVLLLGMMCCRNPFISLNTSRLSWQAWNLCLSKAWNPRNQQCLWVICSEMVIADIHGEIFLNSIHVITSRLIRPSRNRIMIYQFIFSHWQDCPVLNAVYLKISSHLYSFLHSFSLFFVLALDVKNFPQNDLDWQIK